LHAVSVIGIDGEGFDLLNALHGQRVHTEHVIQTVVRMTPTYTKPMLLQPAGPARELNRLDIKNRTSQSDELSHRVIEQLDSIVPQVDAVVIADQVTERNHGVITDVVREHIATLAARHPQTIFFADSRSHLAHFRNVIAKPNREELFRALGREEGKPATRRTDVMDAARQLATQTGRPVYTTLGADGILYVDRDEVHTIPGVPVIGPIDIVGAGDSTTAGIVCGLCAGATPVQAARLGCLVASITIQQLGITGTATPEQVLARHCETSPG